METKRIIINICMVALLLVTLHLPAHAQTLITGIVAPIDHNITHDTMVVHPGTVLEFPLTADMFLWQGTPGAANAPVAQVLLRASGITVTHRPNQPQVIESVTLSTMQHNGAVTSSVRVEFVEEFVSVGSREFDVTIHLMLRNTRIEESAIRLRGDFENEEVSVYDVNFVNLSGGRVLVANENVANLEIYIGDRVNLVTRVSRGQRYYARAVQGLTNADAAMIERFPSIQTAVRIRTVGILPHVTRVSLGDVGDYYAYNAIGSFLGVTRLC